MTPQGVRQQVGSETPRQTTNWDDDFASKQLVFLCSAPDSAFQWLEGWDRQTSITGKAIFCPSKPQTPKNEQDLPSSHRPDAHSKWTLADVKTTTQRNSLEHTMWRRFCWGAVAPPMPFALCLGRAPLFKNRRNTENHRFLLNSKNVKLKHHHLTLPH